MNDLIPQELPISLVPGAAIDLKNAVITYRDGFVLVGAVNNGAGYSTSATTMVVDGFVGTCEADTVVGDIFTVTGSTAEHKVTAKIDTGDHLTSVTFTPGLTGNVADNAVVTFKRRRLEVTIGEGNLTYSEIKNRTYVKNRGLLDTVKNADEEPVEVQMDYTWEFLEADTTETPTVEDVLKQRGQAAHWVTTSADACEPYCVDIEIEYTPFCSASKKELIALKYFLYEKLDHDIRQSTVSCTGKCNITEADTSRVTAFT